MKKILLSFFIGVMLIACNQKTVSVREVWTKEQANEWYFCNETSIPGFKFCIQK